MKLRFQYTIFIFISTRSAHIPRRWVWNFATHAKWQPLDTHFLSALRVFFCVCICKALISVRLSSSSLSLFVFDTLTFHYCRIPCAACLPLQNRDFLPYFLRLPAAFVSRLLWHRKRCCWTRCLVSLRQSRSAFVAWLCTSPPPTAPPRIEGRLIV